MNFLLLCIQSFVCVACVYITKKLGIISFRDFDTKDAKMWFPISLMLVGVIYTGSKSLVSKALTVSVGVQLREGRILNIAIPKNSCIHNIQELNHHPYRERFSPTLSHAMLILFS